MNPKGLKLGQRLVYDRHNGFSIIQYKVSDIELIDGIIVVENEKTRQLTVLSTLSSIWWNIHPSHLPDVTVLETPGIPEYEIIWSRNIYGDIKAQFSIKGKMVWTSRELYRVTLAYSKDLANTSKVKG